jgi:hypothetical protein
VIFIDIKVDAGYTHDVSPNTGTIDARLYQARSPHDLFAFLNVLDAPEWINAPVQEMRGRRGERSWLCFYSRSPDQQTQANA